MDKYKPKYDEKASRTFVKAMLGHTDRVNQMLLERVDQVVDAILGILTYREREVVKSRYGLTDGHCHTLKEMGETYKVTRERVRQVEAKAVRKTQDSATKRKLEELL